MPRPHLDFVNAMAQANIKRYIESRAETLETHVLAVLEDEYSSCLDQYVTLYS
jgi:hypothetical protein